MNPLFCCSIRVLTYLVFAEKFDQAITDYSASLELKTALLPQSSRQIAEAHYKLSIVLDLQSGRLAQAIKHIEKALDSVDARLAELRNGLSGQVAHMPEPAKGKKRDPKGKGKGKMVEDVPMDEEDDEEDDEDDDDEEEAEDEDEEMAEVGPFCKHASFSIRRVHKPLKVLTRLIGGKP